MSSLASQHVRIIGLFAMASLWPESAPGQPTMTQEEALRLARREKPNVVVLDVMMPGMSGWEVCRAIREDESLGDTGVIMLTGIGERLNEMTSPLYGADGFLDKPFELEDLADKVREILADRESA